VANLYGPHWIIMLKLTR